MSTIPAGRSLDERPFRIHIVSRAGGKAKIRVTLMPSLTEVPYDYMVSFLLRQPGAKRDARAWEIDTPKGIEYAGPGSLLFKWYFLIPWLLVDFDPDEIASLDIKPKDLTFA